MKQSNNFLDLIRKDVAINNNKILNKRMDYIKQYRPEIFYHNKKNKNILITIVVVVHDSKFLYIEMCIKSLFKERDFIEIILISHGTNKNIFQFLKNKFYEFDNCILVKVKDNFISDPCDDINDKVNNLRNLGLFISSGKYNFCISCDDFINDNYCSSIIELHQKYPNANSFITKVFSVDSLNNVNLNKKYPINNFSKIEYEKEYFIEMIMKMNSPFVPGGILICKSSEIIRQGGYNKNSDFSQFFQFSISGKNYFSKNSILYWRHHDDQTNKKYSSIGAVYTEMYLNWYKDYEIFQLHNNELGSDFANIFKKWHDNYVKIDAIWCFRHVYRSGDIGSIILTFKSIIKSHKAILLKLILPLFADFPIFVYNKVKFLRSIKRSIMK